MSSVSRSRHTYTCIQVLAQLYIAPMSIANGLVTGLLAGLVAKKIKKVICGFGPYIQCTVPYMPYICMYVYMLYM